MSNQSDKKKEKDVLEEGNVKKKKDYTAYIIIAIITATLIGIGTYIFIRNAKVEAAEMFEKAYVKIEEFDRLPNVYSKQEMEKELISLLDQVISKHPMTTAGKRALFYKGYVYYNAESYDKAEKIFQYFNNKFPNDYLADKSFYFLSYCYSELEKNDEAIKTLKVFEKAKSTSYYAPLALYRLGNIYETKGDKNEALKYYKMILKDHADSSQAELAKNKAVLLENDITL
jgi:TolA-binding protein